MELQIAVPNKKSGGGTVNVSDDVFQRRYNEDLVHQVVTAYRAGMRQGSKKQKNRSDARGGGRKPWKQKGTGRARAGTIRSPIWVGGGRTFAARPRKFNQKVNKGMYRAAMQTIFSELIRQERLVVVESLTVEAPKTKDLISLLATMNLPEVLIITHELDENLYLAARNIPRVDTVDVQAVDVLSLLSFPKVIITSAALKQIEERLT